MTDPAEALAARIERFEQAADPGLIWDAAALVEAEQAMRACAGDQSDAATWRLIGILHLARYRLDPRTTRDASVAGIFFAAVAVLDPGRLPEKLRGSGRLPDDAADTWAGLIEEAFRHVDPAAYRHLGLLIHALVRRAMARPTQEVSERLGQLLLEESMRAADPVWAPGALELLGAGLVRLHARTGEREVIDDAVHVLLRAALSGPAIDGPALDGPTLDGSALDGPALDGPALDGHGELAAALALAAPGDPELVRAYLAAAESAPGTQDRSQALLALADLTQARAAASCLDGDLLAFIRVGQCALDFWHEQWAHPGVLAPYAAGLIEWFVVTGDERSLEAGTEMLQALRVTPDETARGLGTDPLVRLVLLGDRRRRRYGVSGDLADLDAAVEVIREAAGLAPRGHPERATLLADLANALLRRAVVTGGDPAAPIAAARAALAACGERDPARSTALLLLGQALKLHLSRENADEAVAVLRAALAEDERPAVRAEAYGLVSEVLRWRAAHTEGERRAEDLDDAVRSARQGVELAMKSASDQAPAQRTLSRALLARFSDQGAARDLGEALTLARDGDAGLLSEVGAVLDDPAALPMDEQLAEAATELALLSPDEDVALKLLRFAGGRAGSAEERGERLLGVALRLGELGRFRTAGSVLGWATEAFEAAGLRSRAAYALSREGDGLEELGEPERALAAYRRAADGYRELGEPAAEARQLGAMGRIHLRAGDSGRAVEHHLRAAALCERAGLAAEEAAHQGHAAEAYLVAGDPDGAVACAGRARDLHLGLGETEAAALALVHAARAAVDQGDLVAAGERMAACAIELEAAGAWEEACGALDAQAVLLAGRGHLAQAAACETRLVEIVRRRGQRREPADEWYRIARRRRAHGDARGARNAFELAGRDYDAIGHHDGAGSVRYHLGVLSYGEGAAGRAAEEFGAAGETFGRLRAQAKEAVALTMRASCLALLDRFDEAVGDLDRALELAAADGDLDALLAATLGRARLDVELGELQEAGERLRSALGLASGDPLKEAVVRDRLAWLAGRTGDPGARVAALELAVAGFLDGGEARLSALASIELGFALEERAQFRRARAALEDGLTALSRVADEASEAPFELMVAAGGGRDPAVLSRLAAIQITLGDLTRGRASLAEALTVLRAGGFRGEAVERLAGWLRIEEAEAAGDLERVRALADEALARLLIRDASDRSYLLAKLSACCRDLGDLAAAYEHAAAGYELGDGRAVEHLRNLGLAARGLGRSDEAVGHLAKAVELARATDSALPAQLVRALDALGQALADQVRWGEAGRAYEEGLALAAAPLWRALRAPLLAHRAALHLTAGELDEALGRYQEAISIGEELRSHGLPGLPEGEELGGRGGLATDYADLSLVHALRGEVGEARLYAGRALDLDRADGRGRATALDLITLARLEHPALAPTLPGPPEPPAPEPVGPGAALVRVVRPGPSALGDVRPETSAPDIVRPGTPAPTDVRPGMSAPDIVRPGASAPTDVRSAASVPDVVRSAETVPAAVRLAEALAVARATGFGAGEALALSGLGALDVTNASYARAHRRLSAAIDLLEQLGHEPELAFARHQRSIAAEALGDLQGALADVERACELGHEAARDATIRLAVRLGHGMTAWTHAEHAKASALTTHLSTAPTTHLSTAPTTHLSAAQSADLRPDTDSPAQGLTLGFGGRRWPAPSGVPGELLAAGQRGLDTVRALMSAVHRTRDPIQAATLIQRAHTAEAGLDALWRRIEPLAPDYVALRRAIPPSRTELDALVTPHSRTELDATPPDPADGGAAAIGLLGFHVGEEAVTVLAHRTGWVEPRAFPTAVTRDLLADFHRTTDGRRPGLLDIEARRHRAALWRRLADLLLTDALRALGDDLGLLHLLPHAGLHRIPLHALAPDGRSLIERYPVAYAPSATVLTRLRHRDPSEGTGSLVLAFTPERPERPEQSQRPGDQPATEESETAVTLETAADDIATILGTRARTGRAATAALLPGAWDVVHLSCHGVFDPSDPFSSGIRLADGLVTARQLMSMSLSARLIVLGEHEPAPPDPAQGGDDIAALGQALLHAGAGSVLLTLWPVAAEITRALMRELHTRLRDGTGPAQALREAVLGLRDLYGPAEPELWAPYVLIGLPG
ncbi:CHAT domain-containing protein [Nonomuraea rosea]|uniref:CHAT domain-containing protein n=1 Tax=Nonomuraea rosea TaxID=638574 RepID=UPI0031ED7632